MVNRVQGSGSFSDGLRRSESGLALPLELQELQEQQQAAVISSPEAETSDWPVSIYMPERYEENYAYPLVVWFHEHGSHEGQVESVLAGISSQNYMGLGIQGNQTIVNDSAYGWNTELLAYGEVPLQDLLSVTIRRLRRAFHIHSERIFLAGAGTGADVALQQLCLCPDWYAGAVLFHPQCGTHMADLMAGSSLANKQILWTVARDAEHAYLAHNVEAVQLARLAGAEPEVRITDTAIDPESNEVRFVDQWLLSHIDAEAWV